MTLEELKNSYVFKIVRRVLMKQYPWIKDVRISEDDFNDYRYIIFLDLYIDPYILGEEMDWTVASWVKPGYDAGSTLGLLFKDRANFSDVTIELGNLMDEITHSPAIPEEMRLTKPKDDFSIGSYISVS